MTTRRWFLALLLSTPLAFAAPTIDEVHALDAKCEAARAAKLGPIRAQKTAECAAQGQRGDDSISEAAGANSSSS